jgi:hypothetical protein
VGHEPVERVGVRWFLRFHKKTNNAIRSVKR